MRFATVRIMYSRTEPAILPSRLRAASSSAFHPALSRAARAVAVLAVALAAGCATATNVSSHVDRGVDFSRYRTFDWGPADALPTGDPRLDRDPFFKDQLQGAVEMTLGARGIQLAAGDATPDLRIHYHANVSERLDVAGADRRMGYCQGDGCQTVTAHEASTIVLDVVDTKTNRVVWRGWAQEPLEPLLGNRDTMATHIRAAVTRMLAQMPATTAR